MGFFLVCGVRVYFPGFHPGLKCNTPLGYFFAPNGVLHPCPGFQPGGKDPSTPHPTATSDPNGVLRLSPGFHPGIRTITHPTTRTLKGCNISAPGFNPGIYIIPLTPPPRILRFALLSSPYLTSFYGRTITGRTISLASAFISFFVNSPACNRPAKNYSSLIARKRSTV